jgi:hypothetical protein
LYAVTNPPEPKAKATVPAAELVRYTPDVRNGVEIFNIGGCASCHVSPNQDPIIVDRTRLAGGLALKSPFGTFYVPNISPDPEDGIGKWSEAEFVTALWEGASPSGYHLFPAFPCTSYRLLKLDDIRDLFAYMKTLPPVSGKVRGHDLAFPFNIRRLVGAWKLLFLRSWLFEPDPSKSAQWNRGAYRPVPQASRCDVGYPAIAVRSAPSGKSFFFDDRAEKVARACAVRSMTGGATSSFRGFSHGAPAATGKKHDRTNGTAVGR